MLNWNRHFGERKVWRVLIFSFFFRDPYSVSRWDWCMGGAISIM